MAAESSVGLRILIIGKDAGIAAMRELQVQAHALNATIADSAVASRTAAAGWATEGAALEALQVKMDLYQTNLAAVGAETASVARLGKVAFLAMTAAAVAWTYESVKWAQSYQTALVQLRTQAGLTVNAMNAIGSAAMRNSAALGTTPTAYLQAAYHPASTGMSTAETIAITNYAAKEAAISGAPLEDTTNSLTGVMKAYGLGASQTAGTTAKLNAIVGAGNMHFADLNSAMASGVASTAKTFGVSLTSLGGALAYLTDRGVPAAQAGTRMRMAISLLGAPSKEASTLLQDAGMTSTAAASSTNAMSQTLYAAGVQPTQLSAALANNSGKGGIYNALALLHQHLAGSGMSEQMQAALISRSFGGGRMGTSIEAMYNNIPGLGQKSTQIDKNSTSAKFNADWLATTKTLDFQLHKLQGTVETLGTSFGLALLPPLTKALSLFTDLLGFLGKNKDLAIGLATAVTAVLAPAMGLYLYNSLLKSGGAIRTVIAGYGNLISGQTAEQIALARTDDALGTNDTSLAINTSDLAANDAASLARSGGAGVSLLSDLTPLLLLAGGYAATKAAGSNATATFNSNATKAAAKIKAQQSVNYRKAVSSVETQINTLKYQDSKATSGATGFMNKLIDIVPGMRTDAAWAEAHHIPGFSGNTGPATIAKNKPMLEQLTAELKSLQKEDPKAWTKVNGQQMINLSSTVNLNVDGKKLAQVVAKQTKKTAALS